MKTLLAIRNYIRKQIDEEDPTFFDNDELDSYINVSYNLLCQEIRGARSDYFEKTTDASSDLSVALDDQTIDLPSDYAGTVKALIDITSDPEVPLLHMPYKQFIITVSSNASNPPRYFDILGSRKIWLSHKSDGVYILRMTYEYLPADLALDADEVDFPIGYEVLIVWDVLISCDFKTHILRPTLIQRFEMTKRKMLLSLGSPKQTFTNRRVRSV